MLVFTYDGMATNMKLLSGPRLPRTRRRKRILTNTRGVKIARQQNSLLGPEWQDLKDLIERVLPQSLPRFLCMEKRTLAYWTSQYFSEAGETTHKPPMPLTEKSDVIGLTDHY
jgi:hypothetical protein